MSIRYYDPAVGHSRIRRHYKYLFWAIAIGLAAALAAGKLHGYF